MKFLRAFTAGIAILLAVLILIYLVTLYVKYKPDEKKLEKGESKPVQFIKSAQHNKDYLRLAFFLFLSAAAAAVFKRQPEIGLVASVLLLAFDAQLIANSQLTKRPMAITILILAHLIAAFALCAESSARLRRRPCRVAGFCLFGLSGAAAAWTVRYQRIFETSAKIEESFPESTFTISPQVRAYPDLVSIILRKFQNYGEDEARSLLSDFNSDIEIGQMRLKLLNTIDPEQQKAYIRLLLLLFGAAVLIFALRRFGKLCALLSSLPAISVAFNILFDKTSTLTLPLLVMTFAAFCCFAADSAVRGAPEDYSDFEDYASGPDPDSPEKTEEPEYI